MKKFATWPDPPITSNLVPPTIPETFTIYNLTYQVSNNSPVVPYSDSNLEFDSEYVNKTLQESLDLFKSIVKGISLGKDVTQSTVRLTKLHETINTYFNKCRVSEAKSIIEDIKNKHLSKMKEIKEEIDRIIE